MVFGVGDAAVQHVEQRVNEALFDLGEVGEGERAFIELVIGEPVAEDLFDELGEVLRTDLAQAA